VWCKFGESLVMSLKMDSLLHSITTFVNTSTTVSELLALGAAGFNKRRTCDGKNGQ
jgi:hypothetical protein